MSARVLLVEDNPNNRYLAHFLLERAGFSVAVANNGLEALEMVRHETFDVIVLDIQMPVMDGYETAAKLRSDVTLARVPIVGVSSFAMVGDRQRALSEGFTGYIEKPIDPETFAQQVMSFLETMRSGR